MKLINWLGSSCALLGAAWILVPTRGEAWAIIGTGLGTTQRDFRVYNNFTDAIANNNVTPDANFPGAQGAVMAIWKSCVEWGSTLHAAGNGDPSQPGNLGSGGANYDPAYAGLANGIGGTNDNIFSEIAGSSGSVLAYTETPLEDGWRIRFYSSWSWADGPGTSVESGAIDIQGVATHEFGHAICLGHTNVGGATMYPSVSGSGVAQRSIEADDIGGVQAIYGVASANKPRITAVAISGSQITITGLNFTATGNQIWFASPTPTVDTVANPLVVLSNQASTLGGTQIICTTPIGAGDGDIVVKVPGGGFNTISNAWPANVTPGQPCNPPVHSCTLNPNSFTPFGAYMNYSGTTSVAQNNLTLIASDIPPTMLTIFYYGRTESVSYPFGNGVTCIDAPLFRLLPAINANGAGVATRVVDLNNMAPGGSMVVGNSMHASAYFRDPAAGGANFNTADALSWVWCD
jgi:hypothetical protein